MIVVEIKPSRLRVIVLMALHLAAASSFVFGLELGLAGSVVLAVLAWSLVRRRDSNSGLYKSFFKLSKTSKKQWDVCGQLVFITHKL